MTRQWSFHLTLGLTCSLAAAACDESEPSYGLFDAGAIGSTAGGTAGAGGTTGLGTAGGTAGSAGGTMGTPPFTGGTPGTTLPGGTPGTTLPGGTPGTSVPGGTTGMSSPGGTTGMSSPGGTTGMSSPGGTTGMSSPGGTTGMGMPGGTPGGMGMGPPPPADLANIKNGPLAGGGTFELEGGVGTVYVPSGNGPWPGVALIPGFLNSGPEMTAWGPFLSSWGIVAVVTNTTTPLDTPDLRAGYLANAVMGLKAENDKSGSKLYKKMSGAYGTSGYSMGGGATVLASMTDKTLKSSVGLAPWTLYGVGAVTTPTLHFCGGVDVVADCSHAQSAYDAVPASTPKMLILVDSCDHLTCWFGPHDTPSSVSGGWALAFHKLYLENDTRWKPLLLKTPPGSSVQKAGIQ